MAASLASLFDTGASHPFWAQWVMYVAGKNTFSGQEIMRFNEVEDAGHCWAIAFLRELCAIFPVARTSAHTIQVDQSSGRLVSIPRTLLVSGAWAVCCTRGAGSDRVVFAGHSEDSF